MERIIDWLISMEDLARDFYREAAAFFGKDKKFAALLINLAADEKLHGDMLKKASGYLTTLPPEKIEPPPVSIGPETKKNLCAPIEECMEKIKTAELTKEEALECILSTEFSEWNEVFLYVMNSLRECSPEFVTVASGIQRHRRHVERFLESTGDAGRFSAKIQKLPVIWRERILVVDDSEPTAELLSAILSREGMVDIAGNGKEAVKKIGENYYSAIVTDVDMPVMNGMEFYEAAVKMYPDIKKRIIFSTSHDAPEVLSFFRENHIRYMIRPVPINEIRETVSDIMDRKKK